MRIDRLYRCLVVFLVAMQLAWFFVPWNFAYHSGAVNALDWLGVNSIVESRGFIVFYSNTVTALYLISYIGLFFYNQLSRIIYIFLVVFGGFTIPLFGLTVESGYESMLNYYMSIGDGVVLCMIFFTSIKSNFEKGYHEA